MKRILIIGLLLAMVIPAWSQEGEKPSGKFSGIIFGDYYYSLERDSNFSSLSNTAIDGMEGVHGLQIRRIYLGYDYKLNDRFSTRVRLEADGSNFTASSSNKASKIGMFVKDAYIKWKFTEGHQLIVGIQGPPAFEVSEKVWGNRFLEKTIMDQRKIVSSRDMGISLKGNLAADGLLKYWLMYANNSASKPEADTYKRYYGHLQLDPSEKLTLTAYTDYQARAEFMDPADSSQMLSNDILTAAIFAGYHVKGKYTVGAEAYVNQTQNGYSDMNGFMTRPGYGLSFFGAYTVSEKFELVARFDHFEPNSKVVGDSRNWMIAGLKYMPASNVVFAPNVVVETYESTESMSFKSSITPRLTFSFTF